MTVVIMFLPVNVAVHIVGVVVVHVCVRPLVVL